MFQRNRVNFHSRSLRQIIRHAQQLMILKHGVPQRLSIMITEFTVHQQVCSKYF